MKKRKAEVFTAKTKNLIQVLRFSTLDNETKTCVNNEIFYFNHSRFAVISWVVMVLELLNGANVLFLSKSGLGTLNNRQYFTMYIVLFLSALSCLVLRHCFRNKPNILQLCYIAFIAVWMVWHALLSSMDLRKNPDIIVFIAGMFALSLLVRLKPFETLTILPGGLFVLLFFARDTISNGIAINAIIITMTAVLISCSRYSSALEELGYRQKLVLQANHRTIEKQALNFLRNQQRALLLHSHELLFLWNKKTDSLMLSGNKPLCSSDRQALLSWLDGCNLWSEGTVTLRFEKNTPLKYRIECTPQLDEDGALIGAAGRIIQQSDII